MTLDHYRGMAAYRDRLFSLYAGEDCRSRSGNIRRQGFYERARGYELWAHGEKATGSSIGDDEIRFLYEASELIRPRVIYAVGVAFGLSTFALAIANPDATVYAIDDFSERGELARTFVRPLVERLIREHCPNVALCVGRSPEDTPALLADAGPVDLVFIDGMHTDEAAIADFRGARPFLSERSVMLWHDTHRTAVAFDMAGKTLAREFGMDRSEWLATYAVLGIQFRASEHPDLDRYLSLGTWRIYR